MLNEGETRLEEQKPELKDKLEAPGSKKPLVRGFNAGNTGNQFFLYIPQELSGNGAFPFQPGTPLVLEVKEESLVIKADEREKIRVPFLPTSSSACWLKGTWRVSSDNMR